MSNTGGIDLGVIIPNDNVRKILYAIFGLVGLGLTASQVAYSALQFPQPAWLVVALAVYAFVAASGFGLARANVGTTQLTVTGTATTSDTVVSGDFKAAEEEFNNSSGD